MDKLYPVYTLNNECHDCYKCVRGCHVKAISIQNGHASVIPDKCIACGACESICDAVFKVEDIATVDESAVADNMDCVKEAADACPVGAIIVE